MCLVVARLDCQTSSTVVQLPVQESFTVMNPQQCRQLAPDRDDGKVLEPACASSTRQIAWLDPYSPVSIPSTTLGVVVCANPARYTYSRVRCYFTGDLGTPVLGNIVMHGSSGQCGDGLAADVRNPI